MNSSSSSDSNSFPRTTNTTLENIVCTAIGSTSSISNENNSNLASSPSPSSPSSSSSSLKRKFDRQLEWLECPVCLEIPRSGPLRSCCYGHIICKRCHPLLRENRCPVCRAVDLSCRNVIAEKLLESALSGIELACRYRENGCDRKELASAIEPHENGCFFRNVSCPAKHKGSCTWTGPLTQLLRHIVTSKCAQVVKTKNPDEAFLSVIGDFNEDGFTVFNRYAATHWKPVLFVSSSSIRFFVYLVIYRDEKGDWFIYARSLAPEAMVEGLEVEICVRTLSDSTLRFMKRDPNYPQQQQQQQQQHYQQQQDHHQHHHHHHHNNNNNDNNSDYRRRSFTFIGGVIPASISDRDVFDTGEFLYLKDPQVKALRRDKTVFEYAVQIRYKRRQPDGNIIIEAIQPRSLAPTTTATTTTNTIINPVSTMSTNV